VQQQQDIKAITLFPQTTILCCMLLIKRRDTSPDGLLQQPRYFVATNLAPALEFDIPKVKNQLVYSLHLAACNSRTNRKPKVTTCMHAYSEPIDRACSDEANSSKVS
jgi:hypothetical protein